MSALTLVATQLREWNAKVSEFDSIVSDYQELLKQNYETQVRNLTLEKEAAALRDEVAAKDSHLSQLETMVASHQKEAADSATVAALQSENADLLRKSNAHMEEVLNLQQTLRQEREKREHLELSLQQNTEQLDERTEEVASLRTELNGLNATCDVLRTEVTNRKTDTEKAMVEAEGLSHELSTLREQIVVEKTKQITMLNDLNEREEELRKRERVLDAMKRDIELREEALHLQLQGLQEGAMARLDSSRRASLSGNSLPRSLGTAGLSIVPAGVPTQVQGHSGAVNALLLDRQMAGVASGGEDACVKVWDSTMYVASNTYQEPGTSCIMSIAYSTDARFLLAAHTGRTIKVFEAQTGRVRHTLTSHSDHVLQVVTDESTEKLAVSCGKDRKVVKWDLSSGHVDRTMLVTSLPYTLCICDANLLATGHFDGAIRFWDLRALTTTPVGELLKAHAQSGGQASQVVSVVPFRGGGQLLSLGKDSKLKLVDIKGGFRVRSGGGFTAPSFVMSHYPCTPCMSPDNAYVACGSDTGVVHVWNELSGQLVKALTVPRGEAINAVAWGVNGLVSADKKGNLVFWK